MAIVCPHCATSYAVDPATLGPSGRTVRCARCKETWLARPEDAQSARHPRELALVGAGDVAPPLRDATAAMIDSPSIAVAQDEIAWRGDAAEVLEAEIAVPAAAARRRPRRMPKPRSPLMRRLFAAPTACTAMAALLAGIVLWRGDVVRLAPQTAGFFKLVGLDVNLRGLSFSDVKLTDETVDGKQVLVVEGQVVAGPRKGAELPRLRFVVRDVQNAEIYAWNAVLDQAALKPGERAWFRSRLAAPPAEGRSLDVRFFNRRDLVSG